MCFASHPRSRRSCCRTVERPGEVVAFDIDPIDFDRDWGRLRPIARVGCPVMGVLLTASRLFDGNRFIEKGAVWIDGGDIRFAGPAGNVPRECPAERKDYGEATISPGFIDLHIHCLGTRDYSVNAFLMEDERAAALRMVPRLRELLEAGFTSERDCGS